MKSVFSKGSGGSPSAAPTPFQFVEEAPRGFFDRKLHDGQGSISWEKVAPSVMRSVISEAYSPRDDGYSLDSVFRGRRSSARLSLRRFFESLKARKEGAAEEKQDTRRRSLCVAPGRGGVRRSRRCCLRGGTLGDTAAVRLFCRGFAHTVTKRNNGEADA